MFSVNNIFGRSVSYLSLASFEKWKEKLSLRALNGSSICYPRLSISSLICWVEEPTNLSIRNLIDKKQKKFICSSFLSFKVQFTFFHQSICVKYLLRSVLYKSTFWVKSCFGILSIFRYKILDLKTKFIRSEVNQSSGVSFLYLTIVAGYFLNKTFIIFPLNWLFF